MKRRCRCRRVLSIGAAGILFFFAQKAHAAGDKECMAAAAKGQEVRDQGHLVDARVEFQKCAQTACPAPIPTYCGDWLAEVNKKIPSIVVRVTNESDRDVLDGTVLVDDKPIAVDGRAIEVDPGKHVIRVTRPGSKPFQTEIVAAQSEKDRIVIAKLAPEGPLPTTTTTTRTTATADTPTGRGPIPLMSWIGWGVGAAGLVSFSIFGLKAQLDYDDYVSSCGTKCTNDNRDGVSTLVTIADVSLVIGIVGAAVGTVFYLTRPPSVKTPVTNTTGAR